MAKVNHKRVLKKMAQDWAKSILMACESPSWEDCDLNQDEIDFILQEVFNIANRITTRDRVLSTNEIFNQYFEC